MNELLRNKAEAMGTPLTEGMLQQFSRYQALLLEWNERMNLTAITEDQDIQEKHFLDSLTCLAAVPSLGGRIIDVGTGAGFPGIPLKIACPGLKVTLLDALKKRVGFLSEVVTQLGLKDIEAVHGRAEDYAMKREYRECYDYAFARAVARLNVLSEYCLPFVRVGGAFISQKGSDWELEVKEAASALKILGGKVEDVVRIRIPETDYERALIIVRKTTATPTKYPRNPAKIEKSAL